MSFRFPLRIAPLFALGSLLACSHPTTPFFLGGTPGADPADVKARLSTTLDDLAGLGRKHAGSPGGFAAGDMVASQFHDAGLSDVRFETFQFAAFSSSASSLDVTLAGASLPAFSEVLAYSASGTVDADLVYAGTGDAAGYAGKDVTGKIAVIDRDPAIRLVTQYATAVAEGAAGAIFVSQRVQNLVEAGAVFAAEDGLGPIPAVAIGQTDGAAIEQAIAGGQTAHAAISVTATLSPTLGRNVVGLLPSVLPASPYLVIGAHYDTWFGGAADDGAGVAAMVEMARTLQAGSRRHLGVLFVAFDAEEIGFLGGYSFLRKHVVANAEPLLAFVDLEIPGASLSTTPASTSTGSGSGTCALAHTNGSPIDAALIASGAAKLYMQDEGIEALPPAFGGVLPGDAQGLYRSGFQGLMTACESPYDHTTADTPDKLDMDFLANAVLDFESALDALDKDTTASLTIHDPQVWSIDASTAPAGADLALSVVVKDGSGVAQGAAVVNAWVDVDDFTRVFAKESAADATGQAAFTIPAAALAQGSGSRWIHVTAGVDTPLAEKVLALP